MKIAVWSDLHLEFDSRMASRPNSQTADRNLLDFYSRPPQPDAELMVIAGDVYTGALGVDWALEHFSIPVVLISGNHEPYGHELFRSIAINRDKARATQGRVVFLERATWQCQPTEGKPIRFIGATLWTDFNLYHTPAASMAVAKERLEDFRAIGLERGYKLRPLRPQDTARLHESTVAFLREELGRQFNGWTIVVTHHAPSPRSIAAEFRGDPLNPAFASDLESLIETYQPSVWIHGHLHDSFDYMIGSTRIICNPRGYFPNELNPRFDPDLVIQL